MSYVANQYNYATPLSGVVGLISEQSGVADNKYFALFDNVLDGSYRPITGDVGVWGTALSDASGILSTPLTLSILDNLHINAFRLQGSQYSYPVAFTIDFLNGSTVVYHIAETANSLYSYVHYMRETVTATQIAIRITKISAGGAVTRLYNLYNPGYVKRADAASISLVSTTAASSLHEFFNADTLAIKQTQSRNVTVNASATDSLRVASTQSAEHTHGVGTSDALRFRTSDASAITNTLHDMHDVLSVKNVISNHLHKTLGVRTDSLRVGAFENESHVINNVDGTTDVCPVGVVATSNTDLMNIHAIMKGPMRKIYGKVSITYTDPLLDTEMRFESSGDAYNSASNQVIDNKTMSDGLFFTLYDNDLSGRYCPIGEWSQVGWTSRQISDEDGAFFDSEEPELILKFSARPIVNLAITFDDSHGSVAKDFDVVYWMSDGSVYTHEVTDNYSATVQLTDTLTNVESVGIVVYSVTKPGYPVSILEIPVMATIEYVGYKDRSDLMSIDLLEELTYDDEIEALGGLSANSVTVTLDNSNRDFFNNPDSIVAQSLKRNRKIVPWLGAEVATGDIEWYPLGTFWSYRWDVPVEGLTAKVVGFDTLGLLDLTRFVNHTVQVNSSIGDLVAYVLNDARKQLNFIEYSIDESLYDIVIPYAWFSVGSHTAALRRISECYPMHIYCDRNGVICAAPQKLHYDYYYDVWSGSTNVISKNYNSLYTTLPNIISVEVKQPVVKENEQLASDTVSFEVNGNTVLTYNFTQPLLRDLQVTVDGPSSVTYTYTAYSWGIEIAFAGRGTVNSVKCVGTVLDVRNTSTVVDQNADSVWQNGAVTRSIKADFIQTHAHARMLIDRILSLSENDKYDVEVKYRGDISLSINDPILLLDGIAPDNRYNIKRHELSWNGSLTGSAYLNT